MTSIEGKNYTVDHVDGDEHNSTSQDQEKLDFENIQPAQPYAYQQEAPIEPLQTVDDIQAVANRFQTTVAKYAGDLEGQMVDRPPQPQVNSLGSLSTKSGNSKLWIGMLGQIERTKLPQASVS